MKIAVATIALNEPQEFITRWSESSIDADYRLILDTGSTDKTLHEIILNDTIVWEQKEFTPWRFDYARNYALSLIPDDIDYVIWLDMDEVLQPGWREALETVPAGITRPRYKYTWSWNPDGSEGLTYGGDKICSRHGYTWKHPVHETLKPVGIIETQHFVDGLEIHHHPDSSKSRSQYFPLLELAVSEDPNDDRNRYYLGREYFFHGDFPSAKEHLRAHLALSSWAPERASSYRMLYKMSGDVRDLHLALAEDPIRRETLVALSRHYYEKGHWPACLLFAHNAINIKIKPLDYLCEAEAWGWLPWDLAAVASWNMGQKDAALLYGREALRRNEGDARLQKNVEWYTQG